MFRSSARRAIAAVSVLIAAGALCGCAAAGPPSPGHSHRAGHGAGSPSSPPVSPSPAPSPTPFPESLGPLPADALFRITAEGIQPNGATVDLVQTVFAPTTASAADTAALNAQCNLSGEKTWQSQFTGGISYVHSTTTATIDPTGPAFDTTAQIAAYFSDFLGAAFSGDFGEAQATCAPGYIKVPGTVDAVGAVPAGDPAHSTFGWASPNATYGFFGDSGPLADGGGGKTTVKNCAVQLSPAALAVLPALSAWQTQPYSPDKSCSYVP
jgi:hypothetical protein